MERIEFGALAPGAVVGGAYRVVRPIAEGGMGVIYEVEQIATGALRALKVMHGRYAADDKLRARFVQEARLAASIPSDHVAQVLDAGQDATTGALYIVMELLEGTTLSRELRVGGPFPWTEALSVLGQIAHALGAAHDAGIVHRDLKPSNVFLSRSRHAGKAFTVKLLDFGIAKAIASASDATVTALGTPAWMAPEQTTIDTPIGPQADVWSFGLLGFHLITGRHYFSSANAPSAPTAAVLREVVFEPLVPASARGRQVGAAERLPAGFDGWFERCVARVPSSRFADARAAFESLARLPAPPPVARRRIDTPVTAIESAPISRAKWEGDGEAEESAPVSPPVAPPASPPVEPSDPSGAVSRPPPAPSRQRSIALASLVALVAALVVWLWRAPTATELPAAAVPAPAKVAPPVASATFRMHGSNTIGADLAPALAEAFLQRRTAAKSIVRERTAPDEVRVEALDGTRPIESIEIYAHGTSTAFTDLAAGQCDIGMASRRIKPEEATRLAALGDLASAASEHVIALDGIAVIVNPGNPVNALTKGQIGDLFSGKVARWSEVGGADLPVVVHARDDRSGTYDTFKQTVLSGRSLAADAKRHESSDELSDAVAADARAIGFIGLAYVRSAKAVMVQEVASAPQLASPMTVSTEDYPLARRLYMYVPPGAPIAARDFVDFALSEEGQKVVQATGFVDLRPSCDPNAARCASCDREYRDVVRGACRLSMDFRFERGKSQLDTRALRDLQRVVNMMQEPEYAGRSLLLLGFSDGAGPRAESVAVSQQRASIVSAQLKARGLHVDLERGFGPQMRIADDSTEDGQERNRRVEVWLR